MESLHVAARSFLGAFAALSVSVSASGLVFQTIADTTDFLPLSGGRFTQFGGAPSVNEGNFYFVGASGGAQGIVSSIAGALQTIADKVTTAPLTGTSFDGFTHVSASGDRVGFNGSVQSNPGIYSSTTGLFLIASTGPTDDGQLVIFSEIGNVSLDNGASIFWASLQNTASGPEAIFRAASRADTSDIVVELGDNIPGTFDSFASFGRSPIGHSNSTIFIGSGAATEGLYVHTGLSLDRLVDSSVFAIGPDAAHFQNFREQLAADDFSTAFIAELSVGVTRDITLTLNTVSNNTRAVTQLASSLDSPGSTFGLFTDFQDIAMSDDGMIFTAMGSELVRGTEQQGLFAIFDGTIVTLADRLTTIEGKLIEAISIGSDSIDGTLLAFRAEFEDGTSGIYSFDLATIPAPGVLGVAALGGCFAGWRRRR